MTDSPIHRDEVDAPSSRRAFLLGAAGVTGVAVAAGAWRAPAAAAAPVPVPAAGAAGIIGPEIFALRVDDTNCGLIQKFEGGDIEGVVVTDTDEKGLTKKHLAGVKYNEFNIQMGLSMGEPVRKWIESSLQMNYLRKSGEVQAGDFKRDVRQVREFHDALITEIGFPGADGGAKDPAFLTLKFAPELTRNKKGSGKVENPVDVRQKQFLPSNFRLTISGLEAASAKVSKVDPIVVTQRNFEREPSTIEFPNLKITVSEEYANDFWAWHEDFVVKGNNDDAHERAGSLQYLATNGSTVLLTLGFEHLGIFKGTAEASENNSDKIRRVTFEMYMESMSAKFA